MIEVEDLHHVSIPVTDTARSRRFYEDVLGLQPITRPPFDFHGAWYSLGTRQLHLIEEPRARTLRASAKIDSHDGHFALRVRSYAATKAHLEALGIPMRDRPRNRTPWPQIFITDPDGNVIELNAAALDDPE